MPINTLPASPAGELSHNDVREKINEVITEVNTSSGVSSFNSRVGAVTPDVTDYSQYYNEIFDNQVLVKTPQDLQGTLDSSKVYFIDGVIDFTGTSISIEVPAGGLTLRGHNFDISKLMCSDANYTMFVSPVGGSGNLLGAGYAVEVTGLNSQVYNLSSATGFDAFEFDSVNYESCVNLGEIDGYRQGFETGTGRIGGSPTLTLSGTWLGGYFINSSITLQTEPTMTEPLFKAGTAFVMNSRFRSNMNLSLVAGNSYFDFAAGHFPNPSTIQINESIVNRSGVFDPTDPNITPNITASDLACQWSDNIGMGNTYVGGKVSNGSNTTTVIATQSVFEDLLGSYSTAELQHFDSPSSGQLRNLGNTPRDFIIEVSGVIDGPSNDDIVIKLRKWDDSASAFVDIGSQERRVDNLVGIRDVAYFGARYTTQLDQNDYVYAQVANNSGTGNVVLEVGDLILITER
jgi:hypothetical protein